MRGGDRQADGFELHLLLEPIRDFRDDVLGDSQVIDRNQDSRPLAVGPEGQSAAVVPDIAVELVESGLVTEPLTHAADRRVLEWNIGLTNMVERASPSITDLTLDELRAGAKALQRKLVQYQPGVVCFNGKRIYEIYSGKPCDFGLQADRIGTAFVYVMPSTSARTASYQRADKLVFFLELKALVDRARRRAAS
jgi:G:T/U-mismatch repair DNA glycosylase